MVFTWARWVVLWGVGFHEYAEALGRASILRKMDLLCWLSASPRWQRTESDKRTKPSLRRQRKKKKELFGWRRRGDLFTALPKESDLHLSFGNTSCPCCQHRQQCTRSLIDPSTASRVSYKKTQMLPWPVTTWQSWNQLLRGWENTNTAEQASAWRDIKAGWHEAPVANWSAVKRWQHPRIWTSSGPQGKIGCSTSHAYLLRFLPCCHAMWSPVSSALDQHSGLQKVSHRHKRKGWGQKNICAAGCSSHLWLLLADSTCASGDAGFLFDVAGAGKPRSLLPVYPG